MKISLRTDIATSGAHEGLLISTGFYTPDKLAIASPIGPNCVPFRQFFPSFCSNSNGFSESPFHLQNGMEVAEQWHQQQNITSPAENDQNSADYQRNNDEVPKSTAEVGPPMPTNAETILPEMEIIKLNLFGNANGNPSNKGKCTAQLFPLNRHSKGPSFSNLDDKKHTDQKCQRKLNSPLLCDTTTTRTTVEVFRAKPDSAHFFQLPKGPLSTAKQSVELIPVGGPDYERTDRSETQFSDRVNSLRHDSAPKSLQWGECSPRLPSPSIGGQMTFSPSADGSSFAAFSPPRQCSTPLLSAAESQRPTTENRQEIVGPIASSPRSSADGLTTVLRRQRCDKSERFIRERKSDGGTEEKVPPRPPKSRDKTKTFWEGNKTPPRPPKPIKYLRKSQSAGLIASDNVLKLYQTRDCLGRIVYEW
ncbi:hypothetical protein niasHT_005324 [Heterodera trifolii]|uniref:Uncharacterized protein n=1 Tax=Heterodera trifolii TaxID=157864 RepID=A0ABD2M0T0_9BILA